MVVLVYSNEDRGGSGLLQARRRRLLGMLLDQVVVRSVAAVVLDDRSGCRGGDASMRRCRVWW